MEVLFSENLKQFIANKYIFLDNDFLQLLSEDEEFFKNILVFFVGSFFLIDSFTVLEFLRDIFIPKQRLTKEKFIFNEKFFLPAISHQDIFQKTKDNSLLLSKIYKQQIQRNKNNTACSPSVVDLFLAARLMYHANNYLLITGNKKDFPSSVFDLVGSINYEDSKGNLKSFSVIVFNKNKFDVGLKQLNELKVTSSSSNSSS